MRKRFYILTFILSWLTVCAIHVYGDENTVDPQLRRHIILAIDGSGSFYNQKALTSKDAIETFLLKLLDNENSSYLPEKLQKELENGSDFYNPSTDMISVFDFGMTQANRIRLLRKHQQGGNNVPDDFIEDINNNLIHLIGQAGIGEQGTYADLVRKGFHKQGNTYEVTYSHLIYPTIMDFMSNSKPAEEYIFLFVSDFLSGSYASSKYDWINFNRDVLGKGSQDNALFNEYQQHYQTLNDRFYRIDYFDYAPEPEGSLPTLYAYKVRPMVGDVNPDNVSISIESDLNMKEVSKGKYSLSPLNIKFTHDHDNLNVEKIDLIISDLDGKQLYAGNYARMENGELVLDSKNKIGVDRERNYYMFPSFDVEIPGLNEDQNDNTLVVKFLFGCRVSGDGIPAIPYTYVAKRDVPVSTINFIDTERRILWTKIAIISAIILIIVALIMLGRKKKLDYYVGKFAQKYVDVSDTEGSVELPCWFYKKNSSTSHSLLVEGDVSKCVGLSIGGKVRFFARLQDGKPNGFKYYINKKSANDFVEIPLKHGKFKFNVDVSVADPSILNSGDLYLCEVKLDFKIESSVMGLIKRVDVPLEYPELIRFYFKNDLGRSWVGIDPGTTGSCLAYGNTGGALDNPSIRLVEHAGSPVIPSRLAFDKKVSQSKGNTELEPGLDYSYGGDVATSWRAFINSRVPVFKSIKKLLGYKNSADDLISVKFADNSGEYQREFTGLELAHLLVKSIKKELETDISSLTASDHTRYVGEADMAKRAVVAIPNNYTLPKISDMVKSVRMLGCFEEVRFIYEAEGILFNYFRKNYKHVKPGVETIMVYDMGGATINVSVFNVEYVPENGSMYYHIKTLGRIGYAVGGDNIDVALMEYIFNNKEYLTETHTERESREFEIRHKNRILEEMLTFKKSIIQANRGNKAGSDMLTDDMLYRAFLTNVVTGYDTIRESNDETKNLGFTQRADKVINSKELHEYVYSNIEDVISELLRYPAISNLNKIDTIIFAGRSTMFPDVKKTVIKTLKKKFASINECSFNDVEIKTAVAYGACWYGIYNSLVTIDNSRLSSAFGYKITSHGSTKLQVLLNQNDMFDEDGVVENAHDVHNNFASDGNVVDFFQVSGSGLSDNLFDDNNRHKVNLIGTIDVTTSTTEVGMKVDRRNIVTCWTKFDTGDIDVINDLNVSGRDITKENDWAYVFATCADEAEADNEVTSAPRDTKNTTTNRSGSRTGRLK